MGKETQTLGAVLRTAQETSGLTFAELAEATGIPTTTLHRLLSDQSARPNLVYVSKICDVTGAPRAVAFAAAGYRTDLDTALRAAFDVPEGAYVEMHAALATIAAQYAPQSNGGR